MEIKPKFNDPVIPAWIRHSRGGGNGIQRHGWYLNDHVEGFITPADEKPARVAIYPTAPWKSINTSIKPKFNDPVIPAGKPGSSAMDGTLIEEKMVDARSDPP